jgi:hypothetical protein
MVYIIWAGDVNGEKEEGVRKKTGAIEVFSIFLFRHQQ